MADILQAQKKIALLHRYPADRIRETNAAFSYIQAKGIDVLTFKKFDRLSSSKKFWKSLLWILYAPLLVIGKGYDVIYCDDSYFFYPALVKFVSPKSKVVIRIGDFHLMYYYSGIVYRFLHFFEKIAWRMSDKILAISVDMAWYIRGEGIEWDKVITIHDPVDTKDFQITEALNFGYIMFHGVLTKNKGLEVLLEAARRLPEHTFVIVGNGPDMKRLEYLAPPNVEFKGWVPFNEVKDYINGCAIGVAMRSDNPGNEYVVTSPFLQYGVMSKPCLVTRRKVFGNYEWQFSGVDELVKKIEELLKKPEEGEKLKKYVLENHDAEKIAEEIWSVLQF